MLKIIYAVDALAPPLTGIGRYAFELANALKENKELSNILYLAGRNIVSELPTMPKKPVVTSKVKNYLAEFKFITTGYSLTVPWLKTIALRRYPDYIFHSPNYYLPPMVNNAVATFHDLSIYKWPECHPKARVQYMSRELKHTLNRANLLITDSEFTRQELINDFSFDADRIVTVPLACNEHFHPRSRQEMASVLHSYNLRYKQYILFTGTIEPRKNLQVLFRAYEQLPYEVRTEYPLVIVGGKGWGHEELLHYFERGQRQKWLCYLGYVAEKDLPYLFSGANLFVYPSLYEGFGLPVLEAMASGTPVICSNTTSLPEVIGDAGLMIEPNDTTTLAEFIESIIFDNTKQNAMSAAGIKRAKEFSWKKCAEGTINAYRKVIHS